MVNKSGYPGPVSVTICVVVSLLSISRDGRRRGKVKGDAREVELLIQGGVGNKLAKHFRLPCDVANQTNDLRHQPSI